jgi:hypothetical protein
VENPQINRVITKTGLGPVFYTCGLPDMIHLAGEYSPCIGDRTTKCTKHGYQKAKRIPHPLVKKAFMGSWSNRDSDKSNNYPLNEAFAQNHLDK